jgi:hypothetical protein
VLRYHPDDDGRATVDHAGGWLRVHRDRLAHPTASLGDNCMGLREAAISAGTAR